jgi:hypothetical protein
MPCIDCTDHGHSDEGVGILVIRKGRRLPLAESYPRTKAVI